MDSIPFDLYKNTFNTQEKENTFFKKKEKGDRVFCVRLCPNIAGSTPKTLMDAFPFLHRGMFHTKAKGKHLQ